MQMRAIRGASTVENNQVEDIIDKTKELLLKIMDDNHIHQEDIVSIIFTVTKDLDAGFPAVAARQLGWTDIALLCTNEIDVPGSLKKCIRVMMHINTEKKNSELINIYLGGASVLRPDLSPHKG